MELHEETNAQLSFAEDVVNLWENSSQALLPVECMEVQKKGSVQEWC